MGAGYSMFAVIATAVSATIKLFNFLATQIKRIYNHFAAKKAEPGRTAFVRFTVWFIAREIDKITYF